MTIDPTLLRRQEELEGFATNGLPYGRSGGNMIPVIALYGLAGGAASSAEWTTPRGPVAPQ